MTLATSAYHASGFAWFRVLGFGLHAKDTRHHRLTFSERARRAWTHRWAVTLLGWRVRLLLPWGC